MDTGGNENDYITVTGSFDDVTEPRMTYSDAGYQAGGFFTAGKISVGFEVGDIIEFLFVQGTAVSVKKTVTLAAGNISGNTFTFNLPKPANTEGGFVLANSYSLYSVAAGVAGHAVQGTLITNGNAARTIPVYKYGPTFNDYRSNLQDPNHLLTDLRPRANIKQVASLTNIASATTAVSLKYKHIGSLMGVALKNGTSSAISFSVMQILGSNNWIFDQKSSDANPATYTLTNDAEFTTRAPNYIGLWMFENTNTGGSITINPGVTKVLYQWFTMPQNVTPLDLELGITLPGGIRVTTRTGKPIAARTGAFLRGYRYYINRTYNTTPATGLW